MYSCLISMKRLALFLLVAATGWSFCNAEDGSVSGEKKYSSSETGNASAVGERKSLTPNASERRQKIHVNHPYRTVMSHSKRAGSCRDRYCIHAAGTPWWPGAPGD